MWPFRFTPERGRQIAREKRAEIAAVRAFRDNVYVISQLVAQGILHPDEAAKWVNSINADAIVKQKKSAKLRNTLRAKKKNGKSQQLESLMKIPRVTTEIALQLLIQFGSLENISNATIEDLDRIPGIGDKMAQTILEAVKEML